ncbi:MAG: hypothetical protein ACC630_02235 [Nitrospinota bacterium]
MYKRLFVVFCIFLFSSLVISTSCWGKWQNINPEEWEIIKKNQAAIKADIEGLMDDIQKIHGKIEEYEINTAQRLEENNQKIFQYIKTLQSSLLEQEKREELEQKNRDEKESAARGLLNKELESMNKKIVELTAVYKKSIEAEGRREEKKNKGLNESLKSVNEKIAALATIYRKSIEEIAKRGETRSKGFEKKIASLSWRIKKLSDTYENINKLLKSIDKKLQGKKSNSKANEAKKGSKKK